MPNTTDSNTDTAARLKEIAAQQLTWARWYANALLEPMTDEQLMHRTDGPNGKGNHGLWIMGHFATADDNIVGMIRGIDPTLPKQFSELFGGGSEPSDDASVYPSRKELVEAMATTRANTLEWLSTLDEAAMNADVPEPLQPFAPDVISAMFSLSAHDLCHAGQVSGARASLGLPRVLV